VSRADAVASELAALRDCVSTRRLSAVRPAHGCCCRCRGAPARLALTVELRVEPDDNYAQRRATFQATATCIACAELRRSESSGTLAGVIAACVASFIARPAHACTQLVRCFSSLHGPSGRAAASPLLRMYGRGRGKGTFRLPPFAVTCGLRLFTAWAKAKSLQGAAPRVPPRWGRLRLGV
jgi:hypothetical protein